MEDVSKNVPIVKKLSPLLCNKGFLIIWQWADEDISGMFDSFRREKLLQEGNISTDSDLTDVEDTISCKCITVFHMNAPQHVMKQLKVVVH